MEELKNVEEMMTKVDPKTLAEANEALLNKAIAETASALPTTAQAKPAFGGKNLAIGIGTFCGGIAAGAAFDHWVVPLIGKGIEKLKTKRAEKKAAKAAKKAAKAAKQEKKEPVTPASAAPAEVDPTTIDTTVKD